MKLLVVQIREVLKTSHVRKISGRRHCQDGQRFAHVVWNLYNPNDMITKGDGFVIHHKDEDKLNDDPVNLEKKTDSKHKSDHAKNNNVGRVVSKETRKKMSEARKGGVGPMDGKKHSEETRRKISKIKKGNKYCLGRVVSTETRRKISKALKGRVPWNRGYVEECELTEE